MASTGAAGGAYDPKSERQSAINLLRQISHPQQEPEQPQTQQVGGSEGRERERERERESFIQQFSCLAIPLTALAPFLLLETCSGQT